MSWEAASSILYRDLSYSFIATITDAMSLYSNLIVDVGLIDDMM